MATAAPSIWEGKDDHYCHSPPEMVMLVGALLQAADTPPLWDRLLVAVIGPLVSVVLGTGFIGWLLWRISEKARNQRSDIEADRATAERKREQERGRVMLENELRHELLTPLLSASAELYLETQHYWRVSKAQHTDDEKRDSQKALDAQYLKTRAIGQVLGAKLEALFETDGPAVAWHKVDDLLTVRYMQLVGRDTDRLYVINEQGYEGKEHSGLSRQDLRDPAQLLDAYHNAVRDLVPSILSTPLRRHTADNSPTDDQH